MNQQTKQRDAAPALVEWLKHENIGGYRREYRFHAIRDWRFDVAWPHLQFAIEIEGIRRKKEDATRHQRAKGFEEDCEKYEAALLDGWMVYRIPQTWIYQGERRIWRQQVIDTIRTVVEDGDNTEEAYCEVCGCSDWNCSGCIEKTGEPCYWVRPGLCSACVSHASLTL